MKLFSKLLICFFLTMFLCFPRGVSAHILETDGTIGGLLHIDPDDDPRSGQESTIYVELKDKSHSFHLDQCSCSYTILRAGELLTTQSLFQTTQSDLTAHIAYTFPEKNIYTLEIHGTPINNGTFQPFTLRYTIRVEKEFAPAMSDMQPPSTWLRVFVLVPLGIVIAVLLFMRQRKDKKRVFVWFLFAALVLHLFPLIIFAEHTHVYQHATEHHQCCMPQPIDIPHTQEFIPFIASSVPLSLQKSSLATRHHIHMVQNRSP